MDYEKLYKEALERAREELGSGCFDRGTVEYIFPELKESKDERIRKALIKMVKVADKNPVHQLFDYGDIPYSDMISWLEKQGEMSEQKPADKSEPKFNVGDWITNNCAVWCIESIHNGLYNLKGPNGGVISNSNPKAIDNNFRIWTIQDAKNGDVLCMHSFESDYDCVFLYHQTYEYEPNRTVAAAHCCINIYANKTEFGIQGPDCIDIRRIEPATEYQRNLLFQKMHEEGYEWDAEKKELKSIDEWVDLGLPSGTVWKSFNEIGFFTYDEAVNDFGDKLPTKEQFEELKSLCIWKWVGNGYKVIGPNRNSIFLPASGYRSCYGNVFTVGTYGYYWSSTPYDSNDAWFLNFYFSEVYMDSNIRCYERSVRLVKNK